MAHRSVSEVMTSGVVTVAPGTRFKELARLMAEHDVSCLPVLAENGSVAATGARRRRETASWQAGLSPICTS